VGNQHLEQAEDSDSQLGREGRKNLELQVSDLEKKKAFIEMQL